MFMYIFKHVPEDFVVEELASLRLKPEGRFLILKVTKRSRNSEEVAQLLADRFKVPRKAVGYAGSKDRNAVTTQHYSVERGRQDLEPQNDVLTGLQSNGIDVELLGFVDEPLGLGALEGNRFAITMRNLEGDEDLTLPHSIPNYFDEQRFSSHNAQIGEAIIRKEFKNALGTIRESNEKAYHLCEEFLSAHQNQFAAALMRLPKQLIRMYLHSYQSLLWNRALAKYVQRCTERIGCQTGQDLVEVPFSKIPYSLGEFIMPDRKMSIENLSLPIPGFDLETENDELLSILTDVLAGAGITQRDFVIRQLPNLSLEGAPRDAFMIVKDYSYSEFEDDEHFPGKRKTTLRFSLGKGSYATMVVKSLVL
jgi:tRNA pseudouridine13 synthase